ncbi:MAG: aldo/keto reductase [Bacteroidales bacterium]|nr:aldo/keto reductase [Candidatus Hennigimonas equi]
MTTERLSQGSGAGKLVLGTVQFGCRYGINSAGRPGENDVRDILRRAADEGISLLDTSSAYGDAEQVLGRCIGGSSPFGIVSKYPAGYGKVEDVFRATLHRLGTDRLYGYLLHHFSVFRENPAVWDDFLRIRESGLCRKIGFSLYEPEELEIILDSKVDFDLLQIPRNVFDRKFDPYLAQLNGRGVEIHVRSTFLQGLFFKDRDTLPEKLLPLRPYLLQLDEFAAENGMSMAQLALGYNIGNPYINGVLIGVDNVEQLMANVQAAVITDVKPDIRVKEEYLLSPVNWQ